MTHKCNGFDSYTGEVCGCGEQAIADEFDTYKNGFDAGYLAHATKVKLDMAYIVEKFEDYHQQSHTAGGQEEKV